VTGIRGQKVRLRYPVSSHEFKWKKFYYSTEERSNVEWPEKD